jgi:hypothetical protein
LSGSKKSCSDIPISSIIHETECINTDRRWLESTAEVHLETRHSAKYRLRYMTMISGLFYMIMATQLEQ